MTPEIGPRSERHKLYFELGLSSVLTMMEPHADTAAVVSTEGSTGATTHSIDR